MKIKIVNHLPKILFSVKIIFFFSNRKFCLWHQFKMPSNENNIETIIYVIWQPEKYRTQQMPMEWARMCDAVLVSIRKYACSCSPPVKWYLYKKFLFSLVLVVVDSALHINKAQTLSLTFLLAECTT